MDKLKVAVIEGTVRPGRRSLHAANLIKDVGDGFEDLDVTLVDPKDFDLPLDGDNEDLKDKKYSKITSESDAFFIVVPEYNHGYPGSLKRLLDSEFDNYAYKPVAIAGVSSGQWGGVRAIEALIPVLKDFKMMIAPADVHFPKVKELFDEKGNLQDESQKDRVKRSWQELIWLTKVMKYGRENIKK